VLSDRLGRHIREYQAYLFTKTEVVARFSDEPSVPAFFLHPPWSIAETPYPKKAHRLPTILSQEEVA